MALLFPSYEDILKLKVPPTTGELHIINFLSKNLDDTFEIFFNPYLNGDRPDVVIMRKNYGVLIIEVKDVHLDSYDITREGDLEHKQGKYIVKSPVEQVKKYKTNLYDLHVEGLLEKNIINTSFFSIVSCAVYFYNSTLEKIDNKFRKTKNKYIELIGSDNLNKINFDKMLKKRRLIGSESTLFDKELYENFKRLLSPPHHHKKFIEDSAYYDKIQLKIIHEANKKEIAVEGAMGSGKTRCLLARAVESYKRGKTRILILTYNITLINFLKDKIKSVSKDFPIKAVHIINYHSFITSELNNLDIPIKTMTETDKDKIGEYLDQKYYSNIELFRKNKHKYDVILIDEVQDFKTSWLRIIKECYLEKDGEYSLFIDTKQNIYNNCTVENKNIKTNVLGRRKLKHCYRSDTKIVKLAKEFQKKYFYNTYELDTFYEQDILFNESLEVEEGTVLYKNMLIDNMNELYSFITGYMKENMLHSDDVVVLGGNIELLKEFDKYYRYLSNEKTMTMFETKKLLYKRKLFNILKNKHDDESIFKSFFNDTRNIFHEQSVKKDDMIISLSILFDLYDLCEIYPDKYVEKLEIYCKKYNVKFDDFLLYANKYKNEIDNDENHESFSEKEAGKIRKNKKLHFRLQPGYIKISTVHSFKGLENKAIFLIIDDSMKEELIYTGITRASSHLIIINSSSNKYDKDIRSLVDTVSR